MRTVKRLVARCTMCPNEAGSQCRRCTLFHDDPVTGEAFPCRFVLVFLDGRRRVKVCKSPKHDSYRAHWREGNGPWKPIRSSRLPWRPTFDAAQTALNFYATARGWTPIWPLTAACEGEPAACTELKGDQKS